jgi:hypothetical protein
MRFETPVVLILYKRPLLTEVVFSAIAKVQPSRLFLVADGPSYPSEVEKCHQARSITQRVDWDCEMQTNFSEQNLGCRERIVSGLNWVFSQVDEAIILEDDCLPHSCFFRFCETLLDKYRHDDRVMEIGGGNYQFGRMTNETSYYFSKYAHTNGWATWRRAWRHFDESISAWPHLKQSGQWNLLCDDTKEQQYWTYIYDAIFKGELKTSWDYQWQLARWRHQGLAAVPRLNLVSNIGFGSSATHTRWKWSSIAGMPTYDIGEIQHPESIITNEEADRYMFETVFMGGLLRRAIRKARNFWHGSLLLN